MSPVSIAPARASAFPGFPAARQQLRQFGKYPRSHIAARADYEDTSSNLWHAEFFCAEYAGLAPIALVRESAQNLTYDPPAADCKHSRDILHHQILRAEDVDESEILSKKLGAGVRC